MDFTQKNIISFQGICASFSLVCLEFESRIKVYWITTRCDWSDSFFFLPLSGPVIDWNRASALRDGLSLSFTVSWGTRDTAGGRLKLVQLKALKYWCVHVFPLLKNVRDAPWDTVICYNLHYSCLWGAAKSPWRPGYCCAWDAWTQCQITRRGSRF